ncbi:MAG: hypothetical protein KJ630_14290 [Proteobacteria bacterium]|nr:hypothetical protein [Pseudomonadota bacterium]
MFLKFLRKKTNNSCNDGPQREGRAHGIDPEMYYCLSCSAEFRLDLPICPSCRIPLVSGTEKLAQLAREQECHAGRSMELTPGVELVSIRKGPLQEMKYLLSVLAQGNIPGLISGDESGCGKGCCGPEMYLQIRKDDVGSALELLAKDFVRSTALDSHDLSNAAAVFDPTSPETVCPACGCKFSPSIGACPSCGLCFE